LPFLVLVGVSAVRRASRTEAASVLAALYWIPLLFWAVAPRGLQMYYYYLPSSLWVGPIVVWAHERYANRLRQRQGWLLTGFVIVCALAFFYFLPIMDGRISTPDRFRIYMWLQSWI